jgi:hypothetical protein
MAEFKRQKAHTPIRKRLGEAAKDWGTYLILISGVVVILLFVLYFIK